MKHGVTLAFLALALGACSTQADNDQPAQLTPNPLGNGMRMRDVQDPSVGGCGTPGVSCAGQTVFVSSVVVTAVDDFDETHDGKSRGTIFVQDADEVVPYAGVSLYSPTFVPSNLRLAPGDVVDMTGQYVEEKTIGSTVTFPQSTFLPQMAKPQVTERFETALPAPIEVNLTDLETFDTGRKYIGMLITVKDVTVLSAPIASSSGRVVAVITNIANGPAINNELWDLQPWTGSNTSNSFPSGTHFKSVTGICDFFFNIFISPRSAADLVQ